MGQNTLYKRNKIWWMRYFDSDNKLIRESSKTTRKREAEKLLRQREREIASGAIRGLHYTTKFSDMVYEYMLEFEDRGYKSLDTAKANIKNLSRFFKVKYDNIKGSNITTALVKEYVSWRRAETPKPSKSTVNRELAVLSKSFTLCIDKDLLSVAPNFRACRYSQKELKPRKDFIKRWEYKDIYKELPEYVKPVFMFAYKTGWRMSEILQLTWDRVDLMEGRIELNWGEHKTEGFRKIRVDSELREMLKELWHRKEKEKSLNKYYVFLNASGTDRIYSFYASWNSACERAGVGKKTFHSTRRVAVTNMVNSGIDIKTAMLISGHKSDDVFRRYQIIQDEILEDAMEKQLDYMKNRKDMRDEEFKDEWLEFII